MNKKKILYMAIIIILIILVVGIYYLFNGNPASKAKAKSDLETYLAETYPDDTFYISKGRYNPEFAEYIFKVSKENDSSNKEYTFEIPTALSEFEFVDGIFYDSLDEELGEKFAQEASKQIIGLLKDSIPEIKEIEVEVYVLEGKHDKNQTWNKDLTMDKPMFIQMIIDGSNLSKQEVLEVTQTIQSKFNREGYDYSPTALNFYLPFKNEWLDEWMVKYMVEFEKNDEIKESDIEDHNMEFLGE